MSDENVEQQPLDKQTKNWVNSIISDAAGSYLYLRFNHRADQSVRALGSSGGEGTALDILNEGQYVLPYLKTLSEVEIHSSQFQAGVYHYEQSSGAMLGLYMEFVPSTISQSRQDALVTIRMAQDVTIGFMVSEFVRALQNESVRLPQYRANDHIQSLPTVDLCRLGEVLMTVDEAPVRDNSMDRSVMELIQTAYLRPDQARDVLRTLPESDRQVLAMQIREALTARDSQAASIVADALRS